MTQNDLSNITRAATFIRQTAQAKIDSLVTKQLQQLAREAPDRSGQITVRGEIQERSDRDGRSEVRIRTDYGDITLRIPKQSQNNSQQLDQGRFVNVTITAAPVDQSEDSPVRISIAPLSEEQTALPAQQSVAPYQNKANQARESVFQGEDTALPAKISSNSSNSGLQIIEVDLIQPSDANKIYADKTLKPQQIEGLRLPLIPLPDNTPIIADPEEILVNTALLRLNANLIATIPQTEEANAAVVLENSPTPVSVTNLQFINIASTGGDNETQPPLIAQNNARVSTVLEQAPSVKIVSGTSNAQANTSESPEKQDLQITRLDVSQILTAVSKQSAENVQVSNQNVQATENTGINALDIRIVSINPPSTVILQSPSEVQNAVQVSSTIVQNTQSDTLSATFVGRTEDNLPVLAVQKPQAVVRDTAPQNTQALQNIPAQNISGQISSQQNFILPISIPQLITGSEFQIQLQSSDIPNQSPNSVHPHASIMNAPLSPGFFLTPENWPVMTQIYQTIATQNPAQAATMAQMTPNASSPAQIGPTLLFFIAAIRSGDITSWLGEKNTDILRRAGRSDLLSRLGQESNALSRMGGEPVSQDWRALTVPFMSEQEIQKLALYYKHEREAESEDTKGRKQTRFLFDMQLDNMGHVQIDGLFRDKKLDLIIRTEQSISKAMQMEIQSIYIKGLEESDLSGEINFHNKPDQWVTITAEQDVYRGSI